MKIENNKIVEITESELYDLYLKREMFCIMDFSQYKLQMETAGCLIIAQ